MQEKNLKKQGSYPYFQIVNGELIPFLDEMLLELSENKLRVEKVKSILSDALLRVPYEHNPEWYSKLCKLYPDTRRRGRIKKKPRTVIKRANIISVLKSMIYKGETWSKYADYLLGIAKNKKDMTDKYNKIIKFNNQF